MGQEINKKTEVEKRSSRRKKITVKVGTIGKKKYASHKNVVS